MQNYQIAIYSILQEEIWNPEKLQAGSNEGWRDDVVYEGCPSIRQTHTLPPVNQLSNFFFALYKAVVTWYPLLRLS